MSSVRALFFDLDDTLCDEAGCVAVALEATSRFAADRLGLEDWRAMAQVYTRVSEALWAEFDSWGKGLSTFDSRLHVWRSALVSAGCRCEEQTLVAIVEHYTAGRNRHRWLPQAKETLLALRQRYKLGLITNGPTELQREKIRGLGLDELYDMTLVSEECGWAKPQGGIFVRAMQVLDVTAAQSVMVGDRPDTDIVGGQEAGMRAVWVCPDGRPWPLAKAMPWRTIRWVAELPSVLGCEEGSFTVRPSC